MNNRLDSYIGSDQPSGKTATTYSSTSRRGSALYGFPPDDEANDQISERYRPGELIVDFPEIDCDDFSYSHSHRLDFDDDIDDENDYDINYGKRSSSNKNYISQDSQQCCNSRGGNYSNHNISRSHLYNNSKSDNCRLEKSSRVEEVANRHRLDDDNDYNYNERGVSNYSSNCDTSRSHSYKNNESGTRRRGEAARMEELADRQNKPGGKNYRPLVGGFAAAAYEAMREHHFSDRDLNCDTSSTSDH